MGRYFRGRIALLVSVDGKVRAVYSLLDIPRPEAKGWLLILNLQVAVARLSRFYLFTWCTAVIERLTDMGVEVWMCTGDNKTTAEAIAGRLGIVNVMAETLPVGKFELIEYLQKQVTSAVQHYFIFRSDLSAVGQNRGHDWRWHQ